MGWNVTCEMQESNQTASSSLTYGSTKHSNRLQPTLVTINAEQKVSTAGSTAAEQRAELLAFPVRITRLPKGRGCATLASTRTAAWDSQRQDARAVVWCRGKEHTSQGQGARSSTFKEPFTPIYFYTRWLKKKKKEAPIGCSYRSLGFYRLWVGDWF